MNMIKNIKEFKNSHKKIYIFGTGMYGRNLYKQLNKNNIDFEAFVQTKVERDELLFGKKVIQLDTLKDKNIGIILGLNSHNTKIVKNNLLQLGYKKENILEVAQYMELNTERFIENQPVLEVTTVIGCRINCKFCPQDKLVKSYFKINSSKEREMSIDTFEKILNRAPEHCVISFCGMAEPLLNSQCINMIKMAIHKGNRVELFTTLEGIDMNGLKDLCQLPIDFVGLHVADKYNYAKINVSLDYYDKIRYIINAKKKNGEPFVNMCSSQVEPDSIVKDICKGKYDIYCELHDRAGNLEDSSRVELITSQYKSGKLECSQCGFYLNRNVVLPDGTVILCCMDYTMKHVLGNLTLQDYSEIINGDTLASIKRGLQGDESVDILCRQCSSSH